jgi:hypothetical protein
LSPALTRLTVSPGALPLIRSRSSAGMKLRALSRFGRLGAMLGLHPVPLIRDLPSLSQMPTALRYHMSTFQCWHQLLPQRGQEGPKGHHVGRFFEHRLSTSRLGAAETWPHPQCDEMPRLHPRHARPRSWQKLAFSYRSMRLRPPRGVLMRYSIC